MSYRLLAGGQRGQCGNDDITGDEPGQCGLSYVMFPLGFAIRPTQSAVEKIFLAFPYSGVYNPP